MDVVIDELIIEEGRSEHIARHHIMIREIAEVVSGDYVYIKGKLDRWLLVGKTMRQRFLTVVVGKRRRENAYGLVTARPSSRTERSFYKEVASQQGGEHDG